MKKRKKKYVVSCVLDENGMRTWIVDPYHPYYHQVQTQIYLSNREFGYLFLWTTKSRKLIRIDKDPAWENNLSSLINFYHTQFIPHILTSLS